MLVWISPPGVAVGVLAGVENGAVVGDTARRFAVEEIVGLDAVDDEAVAGVALTIGEDVLIAEAGVGARAGEEVGVDAGAQKRELREAAGAERSAFDEFGAERVAVGGVGLVQERRAGNGDAGADFAGLERAVDRCGDAADDGDLIVHFGLESVAREGDGIRTDR